MDLSYLERNRLEEEFKKAQKQKRKAEQYAVDAKTTAQRVHIRNMLKTLILAIKANKQMAKSCKVSCVQPFNS